MTRDRFLECLEAMHWSTDQLAMILECDEALVEAWAIGLEPVPPKLAAWVQALANVHEAMMGEKPRSLKGKRYMGEPLH